MAGLISGSSQGFSTPKALQEILPQASEIFGSAKAGDVFSVGQGSLDRTRLTTTRRALQTEIDRLSGFKTNLQPADRERLAKLQADVRKIEADKGPDGFTSDQVESRAELLAEAFKILGKDFVDIASNPQLQTLADQVDKLLEPKLRPGQQRRLETLQKMFDNTLANLTNSPESATDKRRLASIQSQIRQLLPPRQVAQLSQEERREYDTLIEQANALAGTEYLIESKKRIRIDQLQSTMAQIAAQEAAAGEAQLAPTAAQAVRAYRG